MYHTESTPFRGKLLFHLIVIVCLVRLCSCSAGKESNVWRSAWPEQIARSWIGPEYWANRLQDWRLHEGRIECIETAVGKPMRTLHLLTRRSGHERSAIHLQVRTGVIQSAGALSRDTWSGFLIGAGDADLDYRAAALVHHFTTHSDGLVAGYNGQGQIIFVDDARAGDDGQPVLLAPENEQNSENGRSVDEDIELRLDAVPAEEGYDVTLAAYDYQSGKLLAQGTRRGIPDSWIEGSIALVSHPGVRTDVASYWFRDWEVSGPKIEQYEERNFGPVLAVQHTLSNGVLKLTAQMPPLGDNDNLTARLEIWSEDSAAWEPVAESIIIRPGFTAGFRVDTWDSSVEAQYRVTYALKESNNAVHEYAWEGRIRPEPVDKPVVNVVGFTGNANVGYGVDNRIAPPRGNPEDRWTVNNLWFPHADIVTHVRVQKPDLLVFTGDQVYQGASPTNADYRPEWKSRLDYLYKWYLWCWAYGELVRDLPVVCLPDDHDIYQGNFWGAGGRNADGDQHNGGYVMSAEFVKMVERTQTSHLPDHYDPTPVDQGIGVYYGAMNYGGVSFAILEDRKFKSPPKILKDAETRGAWIVTPNYDSRKADVPEATLLGQRQLDFLKDWATDWRGAYMKVALSQTIFCNLQTRDGVLRPDMDSNGWPQSGRNRALRELRRGFAFHLAGDQHLATLVHHGIDDWNDAGYSLCVPSIANFFPRTWAPPTPGQNREPGEPSYTGEHRDGWNHPVTVWAVANPKNPEDFTASERSQTAFQLHRRVPGYGVLRLNKQARTITVECWQRKSDPRKGDAGQYPGWPRTIHMEDNYGRKAAAWLPALEFSGITDPVVQIVDESDQEIVYTLRIGGNSFRPKVFRTGTYTVHAGEPGTDRMQTVTGIRSVFAEAPDVIRIDF
jgi:alkaline phosphatase D